MMRRFPKLNQQQLVAAGVALCAMAEKGDLVKTGNGRNASYRLPTKNDPRPAPPGKQLEISVPRDADAGQY